MIKRVLLLLVVVLIGLLVVADVAAKSIAQRELAKRVRAEVPEPATSSARIRSFPFLARLIVSGRVSEVDAEARGVTVRGLRFESIAVALHGATFDRDQLLNGRRVVLRRIDRGTVRAEITQADLSDTLGVAVHLAQGRASVSVAGRQLSAEVAVHDNRLVVAGAGVQLPEVDLLAPLLPCVGDAQVQPGLIVLSCAFTEVPREFLDRAQVKL